MEFETISVAIATQHCVDIHSDNITCYCSDIVLSVRQMLMSVLRGPQDVVRTVPMWWEAISVDVTRDFSSTSINMRALVSGSVTCYLFADCRHTHNGHTHSTLSLGN